jgi:hypothetical protein
MTASCTKCQTTFSHDEQDLSFYQKFDIPPPSLCFDCRLQRRLAFYNRRNLYKRKCDFSGKDIASAHAPSSKHTVYDKDIWISDQWDPMDYGRDFDFNRPFFEQFHELLLEVPVISLNILPEGMVNSDFTNDCHKVKNCYLIFDGEEAEDCYFGETFYGTKNCMDFLFLQNSELCYECTVCEGSYNLKHSQFSKNCRDSWFLKDCIGCKNCFGCVNLRQKEYHIFNKPYSKEEYKNFINKFQSGNYQTIQQVKQQVEDFWRTQPVKATRGEQNINSTGDNINQCKDSHECYDSAMLEDSKYCTDMIAGGKNCMDIHVWGDGAENCYNSCIVGMSISNTFCSAVIAGACDNVYYSYWCVKNCIDIFGCSGLKHKRFCILNKQYTEDEYHTLKNKIIEHMKNDGGGAMNPTTGERSGSWGQFFPIETSPHGYNETMAPEHFPLSKKEVTSNGWKWTDYEPKIPNLKTIRAAQLPDDIKDTPNDILNWAILCEVTQKPYKITSQELKFYRQHKLPIPRKHFEQRHLDRFHLKNPFKLYQSTCKKCHQPITTSYPPPSQNIIYCESCYHEVIY